LRNANLCRARLSDAIFTGADTTGVVWPAKFDAKHRLADNTPAEIEDEKNRSAESMRDVSDLGAQMNAAAKRMDTLLSDLLSKVPLDDEIARPARLVETMRYSSLGGGMRLRPFLTIEAAALFGVRPAYAMMAGAAIECVHCYSIIHDDLPAMDSSDRRRVPTAHKSFDDATAILAGDSLLTLAFDILVRDETHPDPAVRIALVNGLARAAGVGGIVGGQMLDLAMAGRFGKNEGSEVESDVLALRAMKTGVLLKFCCTAGAILGNASQAKLAALRQYGQALAQAFPIANDLLDIDGDAAALALGKPATLGMTTMVGLLGAAGARTRLSQLVAEAESALRPFGSNATVLVSVAHFIGRQGTRRR
jgi:farnesyl diphosphate synthase